MDGLRAALHRPTRGSIASRKSLRVVVIVITRSNQDAVSFASVEPSETLSAVVIGSLDTEVRMFWVYLLRCADAHFYVGHTDNLERRVVQHEQGIFDSCYTFERRPVTLVFCQGFATREEALAMERRVPTEEGCAPERRLARDCARCALQIWKPDQATLKLDPPGANGKLLL
jgi:predicted GIY-YIG superfamily endonuclease